MVIKSFKNARALRKVKISKDFSNVRLRRFLLFEAFPFPESESKYDRLSIDNLKLEQTLKTYIDDRFLASYRVSYSFDQENPKYDQELFDTKAQQWIPCYEQGQHVFRFLMQWLLVQSPHARRDTLDLYNVQITET